jgi:mono/diheme cytochrome c family protein
MRLILLPPIVLLCTATLCSALLSGAEPSPESSEFFEKQVRPVLLEHCTECHGPDVAESKLRVDSLAGLLTGGERGPAIVPGKPRESLLVAAINHDDVLQMPPKRKLSARQIRGIAKWIEAGATWPGMTSATATAADGSRGGFG